MFNSVIAFSSASFWDLPRPTTFAKCRGVRTGRSLPGDLFLIGELYGWDGTPDKGDHASIAEIATRIQNYKIQRGWRFQDVHNPKKWNDMFRRNFSDDAIGQEMNGYSAQEEFKNHVLINGIPHPGIPFELVSKPPGSRETGFALVRERLMNTAARPDSKIREGKGLFIVKEHCPNTARTLPILSRNPKKPDDVDPACESHIYDAIRYALAADREAQIRRPVGSRDPDRLTHRPLDPHVIAKRLKGFDELQAGLGVGEVPFATVLLIR